MIARRAALSLLIATVAAGARAAEPTRVFALALRDGRAEGEGVSRTARGAGTIVVRQGERVELRWTVDRPTEVHLHGYGLEIRAGPGAAAVLGFVARAGGRFPVEVHDERGRHATVLYVEVHPR